MADMSLPWAGDLTLDSTGDFVTVTQIDELIQRVIRRFLTNTAQYDSSGNVVSVGDYIWDQTYGGNARAFVDAVISDQTAGQIQHSLLNQILQESEAAQNPAPTVQVVETTQGLQINATVVSRSGQVALIPQLEITN